MQSSARAGPRAGSRLGEAEALTERSRRPRGAGLLAKLALLGTTGLLCFLTAEGVLRIAYPKEPVFIQEHPTRGFANIPGKEGWWRRETEQPVRVEINSKGLRDEERPYEKPPGVVRVMMLGDSFIGAFNTPFEEIASQRLQALLRERLGTDRIEVVNAGTQGYGTAQELLFLQEEGFRYQPDIVVLNVYLGNDFGNNHVDTAAPTKAAFSLEEGELVLHEPRHVEGMGFLRDEILAKSALAAAIRRSGIIGLLGGQRLVADLGLVSGDGGGAADAETVRATIEVTKALVTRMARAVRERGIDFYVHLIPPGLDLVRYVPEDSGLDVRDTRPPRRKELLKRYREALVGHLEELDVPVVFAWERMVRDTEEGRLLFAGGVGHWTPTGNRRAAQDVLRAILPQVRAELRDVEQGAAMATRGEEPAP